MLTEIVSLRRNSIQVVSIEKRCRHSVRIQSQFSPSIKTEKYHHQHNDVQNADNLSISTFHPDSTYKTRITPYT